MLVEQLIFTVLSFFVFIVTFYKMIKSNDTSYVFFLILSALGILLNLIEVIGSIKMGLVIKILMYIFAVIIPIIIIILEKFHLRVMERLNIFKAKMYFKMGNNKKAKQLLIKLFENYPNSYQAHKLLAEIYESEGGGRKAIDEYVQAIDINKKDFDSYFKVATLLNEMDKKQEATQMLANLLSKKPDYKEATILYGDLLIDQQMYKEAARAYHEALKYNQFDFDLNYNIAIVYTMMNDFQNAKMFYDKSAEINSLNYNCKYYLAEIALICKEIEEAEKKFMQTIDDEELAPDSYYELSKIALIRGDKERAIQYANTAIDLNPKKIAEKIKKEAIFIPIIAKLSIPFNLEQNQEAEERKPKLSKKEIEAKEQLEKMFELTRQLSYNDIRLLRTEKYTDSINLENNIERQQ